MIGVLLCEWSKVAGKWKTKKKAKKRVAGREEGRHSNNC